MKSTNTDSQGEFSRRLSAYISESDYTIYKISQITGLGRTAIQHTMSGKLVPAKAFVDKLLSVLPITPFQREELSEMYMKEKLGERTYASRQHIKAIIENLPQYHIDSDVKSSTVRNPALTDGFSAVNGIMNVNSSLLNIVCAELEKAEPAVYCTIPSDDKLFFEMTVQLLGCCKKKIIFEHFIRIFKTDKNTHDNNMSILENALKLSLSSPGCKAYYHYAYRDCLDDFLPAFPYCLVTPSCAALVSADFQNAVIGSAPSFIAMAESHIRNIRSHSMPMIDSYDDCRGFRLFTESTRMYKASVEFQPCLLTYINEKIIAERFRDIKDRDEIIRTVMNTFFTDEGKDITSHQKFKNYFTKNGLEDFAQTGIMANMPGCLFNPLSVEERIYILEKMKYDAGNYVMLDNIKLSVPKSIQIISLTNRNIIICCTANENPFCCVLTEPGLCGAFEDFILNIEESCSVFSEDELKDAIESCINRLREHIPETSVK